MEAIAVGIGRNMLLPGRRVRSTPVSEDEGVCCYFLLPVAPLACGSSCFRRSVLFSCLSLGRWAGVQLGSRGVCW